MCRLVSVEEQDLSVGGTPGEGTRKLNRSLTAKDLVMPRSLALTI